MLSSTNRHAISATRKRINFEFEDARVQSADTWVVDGTPRTDKKCGRASTSISLYVSSMIEAGLKWNNATRRQRQVNTSNATELRQRCFNV